MCALAARNQNIENNPMHSRICHGSRRYISVRFQAIAARSHLDVVHDLRANAFPVASEKYGQLDPIDQRESDSASSLRCASGSPHSLAR